MKFLCVYGHGKETERSYWSVMSLLISAQTISLLLHRYARGPNAYEDNFGEAVDPVCQEPDCETPKSDIPLSRRSWIDADYTDENMNPKVGILFLISLTSTVLTISV